MTFNQSYNPQSHYLTSFTRNVIEGGMPPTFPPTIDSRIFQSNVDWLAYITVEIALVTAARGDCDGTAAVFAWRVKIPPAALVTIVATLATALEFTSGPAPARPARPARWAVDEFTRVREAGDGPWQTPSAWFERNGGHARWWKIGAIDTAVGAALRAAIAVAPSGSPAAADILSVFATDAAHSNVVAHSTDAASAKSLAMGFVRLMHEYHGGALASRLQEKGGSVDALAAAASALSLN